MSATEIGSDAPTPAIRVEPPLDPALDPPFGPRPRPAAAAARLPRILLLIAITAAAFNLRPAVASFGPLLDQIRGSLHMSPTLAGVLTALPSLCFSGCAFPLALTMIGLRSRSAEGVARLSAFCQGFGYLVSVPGPVLIGVLYQREHGWYAPLALLTVLLLAQAAAGCRAARPGQVEDEV